MVKEWTRFERNKRNKNLIQIPNRNSTIPIKAIKRCFELKQIITKIPINI